MDNNAGFIRKVLMRLERGEQIQVSSHTVSPTYVPHLAYAVMDLFIDGCKGIWHLANKGEITWLELAHHAAANFGANAKLIIPQRDKITVPRPSYSALSSERYGQMPTLEYALELYFREFKVTL